MSTYQMKEVVKRLQQNSEFERSKEAQQQLTAELELSRSREALLGEENRQLKARIWALEARLAQDTGQPPQHQPLHQVVLPDELQLLEAASALTPSRAVKFEPEPSGAAAVNPSNAVQFSLNVLLGSILSNQHAMNMVSEHSVPSGEVPAEQPRGKTSDVGKECGAAHTKRARECPADAEQPEQEHKSRKVCDRSQPDQLKITAQSKPENGNPAPSKPATPTEHIKSEKQGKSELRTQSELFLDFLEKEERSGVIILTRDTQDRTSVGVSAWQVLDVAKWWEDAKDWFEDKPGTWTDCAFFMVLRRLGMRPINRAPLPASSGFDFGLKRKDVQMHGYMFDQEAFEKYNRARLAPKLVCNTGGKVVLKHADVLGQ